MFSYIASPYSHPDPKVREERYQSVLDFVAHIAMRPTMDTPYSPIVHWHHVALGHNLPGDFEFWKRIDHDMIARANSVIVYMIDGWQESKGVKAEIEYAHRRGIRVMYQKPLQKKAIASTSDEMVTLTRDM